MRRTPLEQAFDPAIRQRLPKPSIPDVPCAPYSLCAGLFKASVEGPLDGCNISTRCLLIKRFSSVSHALIAIRQDTDWFWRAHFGSSSVDRAMRSTRCLILDNTGHLQRSYSGAYMPETFVKIRRGQYGVAGSKARTIRGHGFRALPHGNSG